MDLSNYPIPGANVNVNPTSSSNVNVNNVNSPIIKKKTQSLGEVRERATKLVESFNDPKSFEFFCKVAWNLPEAKIWAYVEQARKGNNPVAYFIYLCNMELKKL